MHGRNGLECDGGCERNNIPSFPHKVLVHTSGLLSKRLLPYFSSCQHGRRPKYPTINIPTSYSKRIVCKDKYVTSVNSGTRELS